MSDTDRRSPTRDILQRFPELGLIDDETVRNETAHLLQSHDEPYFWRAPAASSYDYHNMYCCGKYGLWIHTKMVYTAYERFVDSFLVQGRIDGYEADLGRAAVLLHDYRKYGTNYTEGKYATSDHDLLAAELVREHSALDERVADAIASHMGPFDKYEGPLPETELQRLVHMSDMAASTKNGTFGLYNPHSDIREHYPSIPEADL